MPICRSKTAVYCSNEGVLLCCVRNLRRLVVAATHQILLVGEVALLFTLLFGFAQHWCFRRGLKSPLWPTCLFPTFWSQFKFNQLKLGHLRP